VIRRIVKHIQGNAIACVALFFAVGGGGGYAVAATISSSNVIHACEVTRTGELLVKTKCAAGQRAVSWNKTGVRGATGAAGTSAVQAFASVDSSGAIVAKGLTVQPQGNGVWDVTVTAPACKNQTIVANVTPQALASSDGTPVAWADGSGLVEVTAGLLQNGTVTPSAQVGFSIQIECGVGTS
jgi:hypothetical protein